MTQLEGRRFLVTGGTGGLGPAVVAGLAGRGADVTATYRDRADAEVLRGLAADLPGTVTAHVADVLDAASVEALRSALADAGPLDGLVLLVGGWRGGTPLWQAEAGQLEEMWRLNVLSAFLPIRAFVPAMVEAGRGRVVTVGSRLAFAGRKKNGVTASAKSALTTLTETLAEELKGTGCAAYCVAPAVIDTPANREAFPRADPARWASPERIAGVIAWLLSDDALVANGAVVPVYGDS